MGSIAHNHIHSAMPHITQRDSSEWLNLSNWLEVRRAMLMHDLGIGSSFMLPSSEMRVCDSLGWCHDLYEAHVTHIEGLDIKEVMDPGVHVGPILIQRDSGSLHD